MRRACSIIGWMIVASIIDGLIKITLAIGEAMQRSAHALNGFQRRIVAIIESHAR